MTNFNDLPLSEQLKALQAGDELHLRGGGWLPFKRIISSAYLASSDDEVMWKLDGNLYTKDLSNQMDIIRCVRPTERKVPEVVRQLRGCLFEMAAGRRIMELPTSVEMALSYIADHFEREQP